MNIFTQPIRFNIKSLSKKAIIICSLILLAGIACLSWAYWIEPHQLKITRLTLPVQQWKGTEKNFRIVLAGDLHLAPNDNARLARIVSAINKEKPDAVLLVGDYVKGSKSRQAMRLTEITEELKPLSQVSPCFAVLGNHDEWQGANMIKKALQSAGITLVENKNILIENKQNTAIHIAGIPDIDSRAIRWKDIPFLSSPSSEPTVFLSHQPNAVPHLPDKGIDLILCGHTHGGQICLPGGIPIITNCSREGKKYVSGLNRKNNTFVYTTRGLGTSILPLRLFCPPEIAVITLSGNQDEPSLSSEDA